MARIDIEMNVKGNAIDSLEKIDKKIQNINKSLSETDKKIKNLSKTNVDITDIDTVLKNTVSYADKLIKSQKFVIEPSINPRKFDSQIADALSNSDILSVILSNAISGAGAGAGAGATIGSVITYAEASTGAGIGAGIGAAVGGVAGAVNGVIQVFDDDDEAYRNYAKQQYQDALSRKANNISYGSGIAYGDFEADTDSRLALMNYDILKAAGESYNELFYNAQSAFADSFVDDENYDRIKSLYDYQAKYEGMKDAEKINIQNDIISKVLGTGGDESRSYDTQTEGEITALNDIYEKYNSIVERFEKGDKSIDTDEYMKALGQLDTVLNSLDSLSESAYFKSPLGQLEDDINNQLVDNIQYTLKDSFYTVGYNLGKNLSEGINCGAMSGVINVDSILGNIGEYGRNRYTGFRDKENIPTANSQNRKYTGRGHAYGLSYVPYDGYSATLHQGERILTAVENRNYSTKKEKVVVSGNSFVVREEADVDKIALAILNKIEQADLSYYG